MTFLERLKFRTVRPTDIPVCYELEQAAYPSDEAASKSALQYRQHHAERYFRCAVLRGNDDQGKEIIVGYICSTRCHRFRHESMSLHEPHGRLLAIHSVVVRPDFRRQGVATAMLNDYVRQVNDVDKIVLLAKQNLLPFYLHCGFKVIRPSAIQHGSEQWYDLEYDVPTDKPTYYVADAFCDPERTGTGNPAAVVLLLSGEEKDAEWMQLVAKEFNLSETAFVRPLPAKDEKQSKYNIRYFTPQAEVPLCGHATLAAAAIAAQTLAPSAETEMVFEATQDTLLAQVGPKNRVVVDFPSKPPRAMEDAEPVHAMLKRAWGCQPTHVVYVGLSDIGDILVEITNESFYNIGKQVVFDAFREWDGYSRGVIVCCTIDSNDENNLIDFASRFFAPKVGINEDPVTGSAHCVLAPYFFDKLKKEKVTGYQNSERGGIVECAKLDEARVQISGIVQTVMEGKLKL